MTQSQEKGEQVNVAIVLSISTYSPPIQSLPGCAGDTSVIRAILEGSERFSDILVVPADLNASEVKNCLTSFIEKHKAHPIGDVLFYFSGHGNFDGRDLSLLLGDYDSKTHRQTSLSNSELDNMLRSLNPGVAVKIVDACNSGVQYVKQANGLEEHIKSTSSSFKSCYFLFSSRADQFSYADNDISMFTSEIARAVECHKSNTIRYKDVVDRVADAFGENNVQSPFFVIQAGYTEIFAQISDQLRSRIRSLLPTRSPISKPNTEDPDAPASIVMSIKKESELIAGRQLATQSIEQFGSSLVDPLSVPEKLRELFDHKARLVKETSAFPNTKALGDWLQGRSENILAKVTYDTVSVEDYERKPVARSRFSSQIFDPGYEYVKVTKEKNRASGLELTAATPHAGGIVELVPKFAALDRYAIYVAICFSRKSLFAFYCRVVLKEFDWDKYRISNTPDWKVTECSISGPEEAARTARKIVEKVGEEIIAAIEDRFAKSAPIDS